MVYLLILLFFIWWTSLLLNHGITCFTSMIVSSKKDFASHPSHLGQLRLCQNERSKEDLQRRKLTNEVSQGWFYRLGRFGRLEFLHGVTVFLCIWYIMPEGVCVCVFSTFSKPCEMKGEICFRWVAFWIMNQILKIRCMSFRFHEAIHRRWG